VRGLSATYSKRRKSLALRGFDKILIVLEIEEV